MPKHVALDDVLIVDGVDLSDHARSLQCTDSAADVDFTAFGGNGYSEHGRGLKDATITAELYSDQDAASVFSTLQPLYDGGGTFLVEVRAASGSVSATNRRGSMITRLFDFSPINDTVGQASTFTATFRNAGSGLTWGSA